MCLGCKGTGGTPNKVLDLWVSKKASHSGPRCIGNPNVGGAKGFNSWRWVGLMSRLHNSLRQASRSSCTSAVSCTCLPAALLRTCCIRVNIHLDPATAGVMLRISPRSVCHLRSEVVRAFLGMAASTTSTFSCSMGGGGGRSRRAIVSRSHPEDSLSCGTCPISLPQLLLEDGVFAFGVRLLVGV